MNDRAHLEAFLKLDTGTHTHDIIKIVVTPDGRKLVTAGECTVRVWDAQTRRALHVLLGQVAERSEEVFGTGNVVRMALNPRDGRSLVVLKDWFPPPGAPRRARPQTEVQVFDIETGNLCTRFLDAGRAADLDFSADGRFLAMAGPDANVRVYAARDVLKAGFHRVPAPVAARRFQRSARGAEFCVAVRFVPAPRHPQDAYHLVVALNAGGDGPSPPPGLLAWACFGPAFGLRRDRVLDLDGPIQAPTLAVSDEWAVVGAWHTVPRGRQSLGRLLCFSHDGLQQPVLFTEAPPSSAAFAPTGNRLLVGMLALGFAVPGLASVPVQGYAVSCLGFELRSTYFGHDHDVLALGFLADDSAVSAGGDSQSIHFWDCASQVGQMQAVIRGVGRTVFDARVSASQQVLFSTVPRRDEPLSRLRRQRTFCLQSMTLGSTEPGLVRVVPSNRGKWVVTDITGRSQVIPIRHGPDAHDGNLLPPPDLTLFVGSDDEWILWTRSGYYVASPLGARRMGYHLNRGADQEALFLPSDRFKPFRRPDIVAAVVEFGSEARARAHGVVIDPPDVAGWLPPVIELEHGEPVAGRDEVRLRFSVRPLHAHYPPSRIWILRNDRFAWTTHGPGPVRRLRFDVTLPLGPGRNLFSIRAENGCGRALSIEREIMGPKGVPRGPLAFGASGNLYLLSIGVSRFAAAGTPRAEQFRVKELKCAHRDATAVYNALACSVESADFDRRRPRRNRAFDAVHARLLVDEAATKAAIRETLQALCRQIDARGQAPGAERDVLVVFLAGHGLLMAGDPNLYFLNHDMVLDDSEETGLTMQELGEMIATVPAEVVILIDTCHSGMAGSGVDRGVGPEETARRLQEVSERGMYVLSAARADEIAHEGDERGHGVFTAALLATLKSRRYLQRDEERKTESLNMAGLMAGLQAEMPRITAKLGKPAQTPVFRLFGGLLPLTIFKR